jgi:hypothetical protein
MGKPDALSRRADHGSGQGDNENLTLLAPELFRIHVLAGARLEGDEHNILWEVRRSLRDGVQEEAVAKATRELWKDKGRGTVKSAEAEMEMANTFILSGYSFILMTLLQSILSLYL